MEYRNYFEPIVRRKNPSFSSSLLDEIYRSFDDQATTASRRAIEEGHYKSEDHHRTGKKMDHNAKSASVDYHFSQSFPLKSCSTSSDSSFWTSSESKTSKSLGQSKLAIRTSFSSHHRQQQQEEDDRSEDFVKAKSKALKMYEDLKKSKAKQPVSPGSRLSSFLNSLFTSTRNAKKAKIDQRKYTSVNDSSACSPASSLTMSSCFSKTPSSRGKLSDGVKRTVRFYPVISVIKDNARHNYDSNPARNSICGEVIREKNRRAREVLRNYEKKLQECKMMNDEEDCESCASSDLFDLDNLDSVTAIRQRRYSEELPLYETTSLDANPAIPRESLK